MFHIFWMFLCLFVGKAFAVFVFSFFPVTGWLAVLTFVICAIPSGFASWYLYWGGRWVANPISDYFFKNPVAPKKRFLDGLSVRAAYALALLTLLALPFYAFMIADFSHLPANDQGLALHSKLNEVWDTYSGQSWLVMAGLWFLIANRIKHHPGLFIWLAKWTRERRKDDRTKQRGDGGDAQFAGFWKENDYPWLPGCILLGQSLYQKFWVGFKHLKKNDSDDRHILTMAGSRSGKGTDRIIPNLLLWQDNAIIIDPKGENASITAHNPIRSQAFVIDPYGLVPNVYPRGQDPSSSKAPPIRAKYNPLVDIDPYSSTAQEDIVVLANAMVFAQSKDNSVWETTPKEIIGGVIGHVLTALEHKKDRSLVTVYRLLTGSQEELKKLVIRMRENQAMGNFIPEKSSSLEMAILETKQSFLGATRTSLQWLSFPKVQELVGGTSDFSMYDITNKPMSIYLCFDMEQLKNLNRFVRIFFLMAFHVMMRPRPTKNKKVLLLMDEFFVLGYLPIIKEAAQYCAGQGIKLWVIIQNIKMIEELYGQAWTNIMEATGVVEAFGLTAGEDHETAAWVEKKMGKSRSANLKLGDAAKSNEILPLMTQPEIEQEFSRESNQAIVFLRGTDPMVLRRIPYWELFHPSMYESPPGGVPSRNYNGWTHTQYFGSDSKTLSAMGRSFDTEARIKAVNKDQRTTASRLASAGRPGRKKVSGPI